MAIRRRDFLNGMLLAAGRATVSSFFPHALLADAPAGPDSDPRLRRGGNLPEVFTVGHWLRDDRLRFDNDKVELLPGSDGRSGRFDIAEAGETYDTIIVGAGMAGLSAAYFVRAQRANAKVLVLDAQAEAGGNAGVDKAAPLPCPASTGASWRRSPLGRCSRSSTPASVRGRARGRRYIAISFDVARRIARAATWNIDTYGKNRNAYAPEICAISRPRDSNAGPRPRRADRSYRRERPPSAKAAVQSFADYLKEGLPPRGRRLFTRYSSRRARRAARMSAPTRRLASSVASSRVCSPSRAVTIISSSGRSPRCALARVSA